MKYLIFYLALITACLSAPSIEFDTSINDMYHRGRNEVAGSIQVTVNSDDLSLVSSSEPFFMRMVPDHNSFLATTLVDLTSSDH
jgi:hypothetical protein